MSDGDILAVRRSLHENTVTFVQSAVSGKLDLTEFNLKPRRHSDDSEDDDLT